MRTPNIKLKSTKNPNQILVSVFFLLFCFLVKGQVYVSEGMVFSLKEETTFLTSTESLNQFEADILGKGTLYLNSLSFQQILSNQSFLKLPNLELENAHLVRLETTIALQYQLKILNGELTLSHDLQLHDKSALVLGKNVAIHTSTSGQLMYTTHIKESIPFATVPTLQLSKYSVPPAAQQHPNVVFINKQNSNFEAIRINGYHTHFKHPTPPPKNDLKNTLNQLA